jgi:hypothetical protein
MQQWLLEAQIEWCCPDLGLHKPMTESPKPSKGFERPSLDELDQGLGLARRSSGYADPSLPTR